MTVLEQTEKQLEAAVVQFAELMGWMSYHAFDSRRSTPGFPDRVFLRPPRILFVEFKTEKGRVSKDQMRWLDMLSMVEVGLGPPAGRFSVRVWRPSDWADIEEALR